MTLNDFLEVYNDSPSTIEEVSNIAREITDDENLAVAAYQFKIALATLEKELKRVGFRFG